MKKNRLIFLIGFLILIIVVIFILSKNEKSSFSNPYISLTQDVKAKVLTYTNGKPVPEKIVLILNRLNDPKVSDPEKYNALKELEFYFASQYSSNHDPSIRDFVKNVLGDFAKKNLSKYYNEVEFNDTCADPKCGQEMDDKLSQILELITSDDNIEQDYKNSFTKNLQTAAYLPDSDVINKQFGLQLVANGLETLGEKSASDTANLIKIYFKDKYGKNLYIERL